MQNELIDICPLCGNKGGSFYKDTFFVCSNCSGIFRPPKSYPSPAAEKARYETHNNDVFDQGYQNFVSPIASAVLNEHSPDDSGLDFGAGKAPVLSKLLLDKNYKIEQYDPFFHIHPELLEKKYDYIVCCEVIEHFHYPAKDFKLLRKLLKPNKSLYCMTHIYSPDINFDKWYYKNDNTHVFIYQKETLEWIKINFAFSSMTIDNRMIKFVN